MKSICWKAYLGLCTRAFVPCTFIAIALFEVLLRMNLITSSMQAAVIISTLMAILMAFVYRPKRRLQRHGTSYSHLRMEAILMGALSGAVGLLFKSQLSLLVFTLGILLLVGINIARFWKTIRVSLDPSSYPSWGDVYELMYMYFCLLAAFSLIFVSINIIHNRMDLEAPFLFVNDVVEVTEVVDFSGQSHIPDAVEVTAKIGNAGRYNEAEIKSTSVINGLYFSTVVMTTLGFGDIVPVTVDARLLVVAQTLISYILFALMIGCITRGVVSR